MLDAAEQNGVVAFLVTRIGHALEGRDAVAQPRTAADAGLECILPPCKFVGGRSREVLRQRPLRGGEHAQDEMAPTDEGISAARIVANAPENQRRIQRHRGE
jgi:hypothetical protein